jgi:transcriptional regulator with XRE-family HTH domain
MNQTTTGCRIRRERRALHLTQDELAQIAHVGRRTVQDIERGKVAHPHPATLAKIAAALGHGTDWLRP